MAKYCGYLLGEDWLIQRALEIGIEPSEVEDDYYQTIALASRNARHVTGVYAYTRFRRIKTSKGKLFWCIAFASDDPREGIATSTPPEEKYKALQELLQRKGPPRWYRGS
jgi:hypothetical protein